MNAVTKMEKARQRKRRHIHIIGLADATINGVRVANLFGADHPPADASGRREDPAHDLR